MLSVLFCLIMQKEEFMHIVAFIIVILFLFLPYNTTFLLFHCQACFQIVLLFLLLGLFLPFSYFFSENSRCSYFFDIKCQNNFSYQKKLMLLLVRECIINPTASGALGGPQTPGLINMCRIFLVHFEFFGSFCLFHSFCNIKQ